MEKLTLTALRHQLFHVADQVLTTGTPVAIERHGKILLLVAQAKRSRLAGLKRRKLIHGRPESLASVKAAQWREPENLR